MKVTAVKMHFLKICVFNKVMTSKVETEKLKDKKSKQHSNQIAPAHYNVIQSAHRELDLVTEAY